MQHVFDFLGPPPNWDRLFFCMMPDEAAGGRVMRLGDHIFLQHRLGGSRLRRDRLHMSLHHVGDYPHLPSKAVYAARLAARAVMSAPFDIWLRAVHSFEPAPHKQNRRPLVLLGDGGEALMMLFRTLGAAMLRNGLKAAATFTPHVTLSYGPQPVPTQPIEPIRFQAKDFVLIRSRLGLTQYEVIDRWPLVT